MGKRLLYIAGTYIVGILLPMQIYSQNVFVISGRVVDVATKDPLQNATVHLKGLPGGTATKQDGSFVIRTQRWFDTLEVTSVGFDKLEQILIKQQVTNVLLEMKQNTTVLQNVTVAMSGNPAKGFMKKVIARKPFNDPDRFSNYSYRQYIRNELDLDNIELKKMSRYSLRTLMSNIYAELDTIEADKNTLPLYFTETISNSYHSVSPRVESEKIIAKKTLGLETDKLLRHLEKFRFRFNFYNNWLPVFDQTYVSPLNTNAFAYYNYYLLDSTIVNGKLVFKVHFTPIRPSEKAFVGNLWINDSTYALQKIEMHLSRSANLNFVNNIQYTEEYRLTNDSTAGSNLLMPYKSLTEIQFEAGLSLLGIPTTQKANTVHLVTKFTSVNDNYKTNIKTPDAAAEHLTSETNMLVMPDSFWTANRSDTLSFREKTIYKMSDSLKQNKRFKMGVKMVAFIGSGYWDFGKQIRIGPYSSFLSRNVLEGWRSRVSFWTLPGVSKKVNIYGYAAYGTKDQKLKGGIGFKYLWNNSKWTKTTLWYSSDYDYIIDEDDELDNDNLLSSFTRKNIPIQRTYIRQYLLKHEQYISDGFSAKASVNYKELNPVFDFNYNPLSPVLEKPIDTVFAKLLPVAEATIGLRYVKKERTTTLNYDLIKLGSFYPIFTFNYTYGFELSKALFEYHKVNIGIEQDLRLPPKSILFYNLNVGQVFGTLPYILLKTPPGNEYHVASRYLFNTMIPYEFAADMYISLQTRLTLGGTLLDMIPYLRKLGWRERFSYNMFWGSLSDANKYYNRHSTFNVADKVPFVEASAGIENIFHVLSIEYFRRFTHLNNTYATKGGVFAGITLSF